MKCKGAAVSVKLVCMNELTGATMGAFAAGALLGGVLLAAAHVGLWPYRDTLHRVANYTIGTACWLSGFTLACGLLNAWLFAVGAWFCAGVGGVVIGVAWWLRGLAKQQSVRRAHLALGEEEPHAALRRPDARDN